MTTPTEPTAREPMTLTTTISSNTAERITLGDWFEVTAILGAKGDILRGLILARADRTPALEARVAALEGALHRVSRRIQRRPAHRGWFVSHDWDDIGDAPWMHDDDEKCPVGICELIAPIAEGDPA